MVFRLFVTRAVLNPCHQTSPLPNSTLGLWNQETIYLFPSPMFFSRTSATATTMLRKTLQFILDVLDCISALCLDFWVQRYGAFLKNAITNPNIEVTLFFGNCYLCGHHKPWQFKKECILLQRDSLQYNFNKV